MAVLLAAVSVGRDQYKAEDRMLSFVAVTASSSQHAQIRRAAYVSSIQMQGMDGLTMLVMRKI